MKARNHKKCFLPRQMYLHIAASQNVQRVHACQGFEILPTKETAPELSYHFSRFSITFIYYHLYL